MDAAAPADQNNFGGGFRAGFPPTSIGMPVVEDPTISFGAGKIVGGVTGVGTGGLLAGAGWLVMGGGSGKVSDLSHVADTLAGRKISSTARKAAGWGLIAPGGVVALMGALAVVTGLSDVTGSLG